MAESFLWMKSSSPREEKRLSRSGREDWLVVHLDKDDQEEKDLGA